MITLLLTAICWLGYLIPAIGCYLILRRSFLLPERFEVYTWKDDIAGSVAIEASLILLSLLWPIIMPIVIVGRVIREQ